MAKSQIDQTASYTEDLKPPKPCPGANARLLDLGLGLPVAPLDRLANFSASDSERFTLEWAYDYLSVPRQYQRHIPLDPRYLWD